MRWLAWVVVLVGLLGVGTRVAAAEDETPSGAIQGTVSGPDKGMPGTFDVNFPAGAEVKARDVFQISRHGKVVGRGVVMFVHGNTVTVAPSSDSTESFKSGDTAVFLHAGDKIVSNPRRPPARPGAGFQGVAVEVAHTEFVGGGDSFMRLQITLHNASTQLAHNVVAHVKLVDINGRTYLADNINFGDIAGQGTQTREAFNKNRTFYLNDSFNDKATITPRRSQIHTEVRPDVSVTVAPPPAPARPLRPRKNQRHATPSPSPNNDE